MESSIKKSTDVKKFYDFVNNNSKIKLSEDINKLETELNNYIEKNKNIFSYKDKKYENIVNSIFEEVFFIKKILTYHSPNSLNTIKSNLLEAWVQSKYFFIENDDKLKECLDFIKINSFIRDIFNENTIINFVLGIKYIYKESSPDEDEVTKNMRFIISEFKKKDFDRLHSNFENKDSVSTDEIIEYFFEKHIIDRTSLIYFMNKIRSFYLKKYVIKEYRKKFNKDHRDIFTGISLDFENEDGNSDNDKLQKNAIDKSSDFSNNDFSSEYISNIFYEIWITEEKSLINIRKMMCYFLLRGIGMSSKDFMESLSIKNQSIVTSIEHDLNFDLSYLKNNSIKEYIKVLIENYEVKIKKSNSLKIKESESQEFNKQKDKNNFIELINFLTNFANEIDRRSSDKKLAIDFENCLKENNIPDDFIHKSNYINVIHILNALKTKEYLISLRKKLNLSEIELIDFQETIFSIITNKISNPNDAKKKIRDFINTKKTNISSLDELVKDIHEKILSCGEVITKKIYPENLDYQDLENYTQSYGDKVSLYLPKISGLFFQTLLKNDSFENKSNKEKNSLIFHFFINYFSPYVKNLVKLAENNLLFIKTKNIDVFKSYFKNNSEEKNFEIFKVLYNEKDNKIFIDDFILKDNITLT